jgi:hypothetical protein
MRTNALLNHDFIDKVAKEHKAGFGFVPFVGSGLSVASGIITAQNFDSFLANTVRLCCTKQWNLRNDGWPPYPTRQKVKTTCDWIRPAVAKLRKDASLSDPPFSDNDLLNFNLGLLRGRLPESS